MTAATTNSTLFLNTKESILLLKQSTNTRDSKDCTKDSLLISYLSHHLKSYFLQCTLSSTQILKSTQISFRKEVAEIHVGCWPGLLRSFIARDFHHTTLMDNKNKNVIDNEENQRKR